MSKPPYMYQDVNIMTSYAGNNQKIQASDTFLAGFFRRHLLQRAMSVFKATMPETWAQNYVDYCLYASGYYAVLNTNKFGVIPQWCTLGGYNVMYQPVTAYVSNPLFKQMTYELSIGRNCEIVKLMPDYGSIMDVVNLYANLMALAVESVQINFFNSHLAYVFAADNKNVAQSFKKMYKDIGSGEPAVFADKQLFGTDGNPKWQPFDADLKSSYIATDLLADLRSIQNMYDTDMGIPNNTSSNKKERQIQAEVDANNIETYTKMDMILDNLKKDCAKVRNMFGIDLDYNWRFPPNGGELNAGRETVNNGAVQLG